VRRLLLSLATLAMATTLLAGCGGGGGSSTSSSGTQSAGDWANGFCGAFKDWASALKPIGKDLQSNPTKANLQSAADEIKTANETLASDLKGLGKPDVAGGQQAKDVVSKLADQIKADSDKVSSALKNISTTSDLISAAGVVSTTLLELESQVKEAVASLKAISQDQSGALKDAVDNASNCKSLTGS
jgi:hypothetical protein